MTATQLLERLATTMLASAFGEDPAQAPEGVEMAGSLVKPTEVLAETTEPNDDETRDTLRVLELPVVLLEHACSFLDHESLHAVEATSAVLYNITKQSGSLRPADGGCVRWMIRSLIKVAMCSYVDLWMEMALRNIVVGDIQNSLQSWKQKVCLSSGICCDDKKLIKGLKAYSSADRPSETPQNTLKKSRCWREITRYQRRDTLTNLQEFYDVPTFVMTLGERIQMRCGCSSGNSCYWSSSASTDKDASDYIDYVLDGPCVISSVQILPYRVFWHPGSPTYGPQHMMVEFYERSASDAAVRPRGEMVATPLDVVPFYRSPVYPVNNEMELQDFQLPVRVWASESTVMRIRLVGRHQAQTFELPLWMQRTDEDRLPKYYCCVSYVNAVGLSRETLMTPEDMLPSRKRMKLEMDTGGVQSALADIMTACFETMMEQRRRVQSFGSP